MEGAPNKPGRGRARRAAVSPFSARYSDAPRFPPQGVPKGLELSRLYDNTRYNHHGGIASGPSGSGVFPVSLLLMVTAVFVVAAKVYNFVPSTGPEFTAD